jgi:hypothetical protein
LRIARSTSFDALFEYFRAIHFFFARCAAAAPGDGVTAYLDPLGFGRLSGP